MEKIVKLFLKKIGFLFFVNLVNLVVFLQVFGFNDTIVTTKIINHGPDNGKKVFAILSEGYTDAEIPKFHDDVDRLVVNGLFGHDFFFENQAAFNVYRVDLRSNESGLSSLTQAKDTALKVIYSGSWKRCWMEDSPLTDIRIKRALQTFSKLDYVLIIANESGFGGCQRGKRLFVTSGVNWDVVAHEYGHGIGSLYDEYFVEQGTHPSNSPINDLNCSTDLNKTSLIWREFLDDNIPLPSDNFTPTTPLTVGMFKGCNYMSDGIYHPSPTCRMINNTPEFCPICQRILGKALAPYLASPAQGGSGQSLNKYLNLLVESKSDGNLEVLLTSQIQTTIPIENEKTVGNYLLEVTENGVTKTLTILPDEPFEIRSLADPKDNKGELITKTNSTTFDVNIPNVDLVNIDQQKIGLKIYALKKPVILPEDSTLIEKQTILNKVKSNLKSTFNISPKSLNIDLKQTQKELKIN